MSRGKLVVLRLAIFAAFPSLVLYLAWRDVPAWALVCAWIATFIFLTVGSRGRLPLTCRYCGKGVKIGASVCHHCGREQQQTA